MARIKYYLDWLYKDQNGRNGKYVIAEAPNLPLIIFMVSIVLAVVVYPGIFQKFLVVVAYIALTWWGILEIRSGRSRFRRLLGILGIVAVVGALLLGLGF